jgi:chromosome segregation ATPase
MSTTSTRNLARELVEIGTEVDSVAKSLRKAQEELARELGRRQRFEQEAADLRAAVAHTRQRAKTAERDLARLSSELATAKHTARVREHELQTRLEAANRLADRLRRELEGNERQRLALETDLSDVMQNLRHAATEVGWPARAEAGSLIHAVDADSEPTRVDW